jgi:hypothetical protein
MEPFLELSFGIGILVGLVSIKCLESHRLFTLFASAYYLYTHIIGIIIRLYHVHIICSIWMMFE